MSITMRVPVWKLHFLVDWRLLIYAHFPNIGILLVIFATLFKFFGGFFANPPTVQSGGVCGGGSMAAAIGASDR